MSNSPYYLPHNAHGKKILFAIKKRGKMSPLNVVVFIIAQTKSRFFFQNFVAKISNESSSSPDYSDAIWGLKNSLPITALCRCNQVRLLIQKIQEVLGRDTTFN